LEQAQNIIVQLENEIKWPNTFFYSFLF
jgi:hypothetical protein